MLPADQCRACMSHRSPLCVCVHDSCTHQAGRILRLNETNKDVTDLIPFNETLISRRGLALRPQTRCLASNIINAVYGGRFSEFGLELTIAKLLIDANCRSWHFEFNGTFKRSLKRRRWRSDIKAKRNFT